VKSLLSSSRLSSGIMTYPNSSKCMVLSLFLCTHFFPQLTIWASRPRSCFVWGAYSLRNRHPSSFALSLLLDHTHQFLVYCPWSCFRKNALLASSIIQMLASWCTTDANFLQSAARWEEESDKSKVDHSRVNVLILCCTLMRYVCTHVLAVFCRMRNSTTLVWELALCTERLSEHIETFDACMEICPADSWENFQSNFYTRRLFNKIHGEVAKRSETPFLETLQERQGGKVSWCFRLSCLFPSPVYLS
jgi:hypothetical protein